VYKIIPVEAEDSQNSRQLERNRVRRHSFVRVVSGYVQERNVGVTPVWKLNNRADNFTRRHDCLIESTSRHRRYNRTFKDATAHQDNKPGVGVRYTQTGKHSLHVDTHTEPYSMVNYAVSQLDTKLHWPVRGLVH